MVNSVASLPILEMKIRRPFYGSTEAGSSLAKIIFIVIFLTEVGAVMSCGDRQMNTRKPGEVWLEDPQTNCSCIESNFVKCEFLLEPVCLDACGKFRKNLETWLNGSCVECACVNGSINCTGYDVNITYGLYSVALFPTCQQCVDFSQTALSLSACKAFRDNRAKLTECARKGFYIRDSHRCNGINECPDGSDEINCGVVKCQDEEGGTYLIKSQHGWDVSKCLRCHCNGGLLTCKRTLIVNFPGYFQYIYKHEENCIQPSCKVLKFVKENRQWCEAAELIKDRGIIFEGQTWKSGGCSFYFPGSTSSTGCAIMTRPICHVYNGRICCSSQCPGLQQITDQMRGNLSICPNGRQIESQAWNCTDANDCLQDVNLQNCPSEVTCQDEDSNQYFEGATWSVGDCMTCSCLTGKINCSRSVVYMSFPRLTTEKDLKFKEYCSQPKCNVAEYMKTNKGICNACRWNGQLYYVGDQWKENGVDFYCSRPHQRVRPGCYIENTSVTCTGAIPGIRELSKISKNELFLCDSGDEIISLSDRCNIQPTCADKSDENNCDNYYCPYEMAHGFLWNRTQVGKQVLKQCSLVNPTWTGTFGSSCTKNDFRTLWKHNTSCYCEKKALVEHFNRKRFIDTVLRSPVYNSRHIFCIAKLDDDRNLLAHKAVEFLQQAPNDSEAYRIGSTLQPDYLVIKLTNVKDSFKPKPHTVVIDRRDLVLQLNVAPLIPVVVERPTVLNVNATNTNVTRKRNEIIKAIPKSGVGNFVLLLKTNERNDKQINDLLKENNCTKVTFDEEKRVVVCNAGVSKDYLKHEKIQSDMELILLCISIAAIILAFMLLTVLRLKKSERLFIHKSLLFSLGTGNLVFVLDKTTFGTRQDHTTLCSAVAVVQYYFHTAMFSWMLVEGIILYIKLVRVFSVKRKYAVYAAIGWGIPAIIVGLVAAIRPSTFDMSKPLTTEVTCGALKLTAEIERTRCWINGSLWIYKGPILVILVINLVFLVILLRVIFGKIAAKSGNNRVTAAKGGLKSIIALLPLLGVTWLVGFFLEFHYAVVYVFILLNSTQGVVFCIFHCFLDHEVQEVCLRRLRFRDLTPLAKPASKPNTTPASKPNAKPAPKPNTIPASKLNTTPVLEGSAGVNIQRLSVDKSMTRDVTATKEIQQEETYI